MMDLALGERGVFCSVFNKMPFAEFTASLEAVATNAAALPAEQ
jgi:hypothetical protein